KILGYRGLDSKDAQITTTQDLEKLFREKIIEGLACKGFNAVPYTQPPGRVLTVEIRQIEYSTDMDFWKGIVIAKAALRVFTTRAVAPFDQNYAAERKDRTLEAPSAQANE